MTFEQDLNVWCKETQTAVSNLKQDVIKIQAQQKIIIILLSGNMLSVGLLGVLALVLHLA
ncbi:MAG: hypothetical protein ABSA75_13495 [Candidatus Bathyarchaeia archaeon]|jgi:hypothetical protein